MYSYCEEMYSKEGSDSGNKEESREKQDKMFKPQSTDQDDASVDTQRPSYRSLKLRPGRSTQKGKGKKGTKSKRKGKKKNKKKETKSHKNKKGKNDSNKRKEQSRKKDEESKKGKKNKKKKKDKEDKNSDKEKKGNEKGKKSTGTKDDEGESNIDKGDRILGGLGDRQLQPMPTCQMNVEFYAENNPGKTQTDDILANATANELLHDIKRTVQNAERTGGLNWVSELTLKFTHELSIFTNVTVDWFRW